MGVDDAGVKHTGVPELADDEKPYTAVGYLNGPGSVLVQAERTATTSPARGPS